MVAPLEEAASLLFVYNFICSIPAIRLMCPKTILVPACEQPAEQRGNGEACDYF